MNLEALRRIFFQRVERLRNGMPNPLEKVSPEGSSPLVDLAEVRRRRGLVLEDLADSSYEEFTPGADLEAVAVTPNDFDQNNRTLEILEGTNVVPIGGVLWSAHRKRGAQKTALKLISEVKGFLDKTVTKGRIWVGKYSMIYREKDAKFRMVVMEGHLNGGIEAYIPIEEQEKLAA